MALVGYRSTDHIVLAELYYINKSSYDLYFFEATTQWHVTQFGSHFSVGMRRSWEFFEPQKSLLNLTALLFILSSVSGAAHTTFRQPSQPRGKMIYRNGRRLSCQSRPEPRLHSVFFTKRSQGLLAELCNSLSHFLQLSWSVQRRMTAHLPLSHSSERSH